MANFAPLKWVAGKIKQFTSGDTIDPAIINGTALVLTDAYNILAQWRTLMQGGTVFLSAAAGATNWVVGQENQSLVVGVASGLPPIMVRILAADYPTINGKTPKLRIRTIASTNDVGPARNFTVGLYPVTTPATSGGSGLRAYTAGTVVTGSGTGVAYNTPAADQLGGQDTSSFAMPADGIYAMAVTSSGTIATNATVWVQCFLEVHYE